MATMWKQTTTINGVSNYGVRVIDSDKLLRMMAQMHLERQAGSDFALDVEVNEKYEVVVYIFTRKAKTGRIVVNRFEKL